MWARFVRASVLVSASVLFSAPVLSLFLIDLFCFCSVFRLALASIFSRTGHVFSVRPLGRRLPCPLPGSLPRSLARETIGYSKVL